MNQVLVFVISTGVGDYPTLIRGAAETWASYEATGSTVRFYSERQPLQHPQLVQFDCPGGLYDMGRKDLLAYRWALDNLEWDYMARVNSSCYVCQKKLVEYVQDLPREGLFRGVLAHKPDQTPYLWGGTQFLMSRDVVGAFVENRLLWNHREMEDVAMSLLAVRIGIVLDGKQRSCSLNKSLFGWVCMWYADGLSGGIDIKEVEDLKTVGYQHFIRVKQDGKRHEDVEIMRRLHKAGIC